MNAGDSSIDNDNNGDRNEAPGSVEYTGHQIIDERGDHIGQITDVIYDDLISYDDPTSDVAGDPLTSPKPTWLVVDPGPLRAAHYVPVAGSYRSADGDVVVPWDRDWVKSAPKARGDHLLSRVDLQALAEHYTTV